MTQPRPAPVLGPYKAQIDELLGENERLPRKQRYIGHTIYVELETNRYSVPAKDVYHNLVIKAYPFRIDVLYLNAVIASHPHCYGKKQDILDPLHYLPLLEQRPGAFDHAKPIRRWRESWPSVYPSGTIGFRCARSAA